MKTGRIFSVGAVLLLCVLIPAICLAAAPANDYSTLKKFIAARMYTEAYEELLKCELISEKADPKLAKVKKELLTNVRKEASQRLTLHPDDATVLMVLADLDFQENQIDHGIKNISKSLEKNPTSGGQYILSKLLFAKGNVEQSFEAMERAFQADPTSEALLADFQFLYNCKNYGLASAKKLSQNSDFLQRSVQSGVDDGPPKTPQSPFDNDPTVPPPPLVPPEPEPEPTPEPDPLKIARIPTDHASGQVKVPTSTPHPTVKATPTPLPPEPTEEPEPTDVPLPTPTEKPTTIAPPVISIASEPPLPAEDDPEKKKMVDAERLLSEAREKLEAKDFEGTELLIKKAQATYAGLPAVGKLENDLKKALAESGKTDNDYLTAIKLFQSENYDLALPGIKKGFESNPGKHPEAKFYLGKIYVFGSKKDLKKAREYFDLCLKDSQVDAELKRDIEWIIIGLLADNEEYVEAYQRFSEFEAKEPGYAKSRNTYWNLKYYLWYENFSWQIHACIGGFIGAFLLVMLLRIFPSLGLFMGDPLKKAKAAVANKKPEKAITIAEDALRRGTYPIQIQRELLEICIEQHYVLKNFFKCQDHSKQLLKLFNDNETAWNYLTRTYLETKNTTDEAIGMYEESYKRNPENKVYLPLLAKHYASRKDYTVEALSLMYDYFQADKGNRENVRALAEAYVQSKRMGEESIAVLEEALKESPGQVSYRELLARNFARSGKFPEAARECLKVLGADINNMGIHVVYTSCMKKMSMVEEAILQYEEFAKKHRGNAQVNEILTSLRKEVEQAAGPANAPVPGEQLSPFSEDMVVDEGRATDFAEPKVSLEEMAPEDFVEPPLEGLGNDLLDVPIPDFLKDSMKADEPQPAPKPPKKAGFPPIASPLAPEDFSSSASDNEFNALLAGDLTDPVPDVPLPPRKPKVDLPPKPTKGISKDLEDLLADDDGIPDDMLGGVDDLGKGSAAGEKDFFSGMMKKEKPQDKQKEKPRAPMAMEDDLSDLASLDPFSDDMGGDTDDDLAELLATPGKKKTPVPAPAPTADAGLKPKSSTRPTPIPPPVSEEEEDTPLPPMKAPATGAPKAPGDGDKELVEAQKKAAQRKWDDVVAILSPVFAANRRMETGILLADAHLHKKKPTLAKEIIDTLEFDRELMSDSIKDILYRTGTALEDLGDPAGALTLYDIICNVDINYLDVFDRSDRLYSSRKKES